MAAIGHPGSLETNANVLWQHLFGGRQTSHIPGCAAATSGSNAVTVGRIGTSYGTFKFYWYAITTLAPSQALWQRFLAFGAAQFGALSDTTKRNRLFALGDSLCAGSHSTDPKTTAIGSGTKSPSYVCVNTVSGGRGALTTLLDLNEVHKYNQGISGRGIADITAGFDIEVGPNIDGTYTGPAVAFVCGIENFIQATNASSATTLAALVVLKAKFDAVGMKMILRTPIDRGAGSNGDNGNGTGWYTSNSWVTLSTNGTTAQTVAAAIIASPSTYCHYLHDIGADSRFTVAGGTSGSRPCNNATNYDDKVHLTDVGYGIYGALDKTFLDTHDYILWPRPMSLFTTLLRQRVV